MSAIRRRLAVGALALVAVTALAVGMVMASRPGTATPAATPTTSRTDPLAVRFAPFTAPVAEPHGAQFQGVTVTVTGGHEGVAAAVSTAMSQHVAALQAAFTVTAADQAAAVDVAGDTVFDAVSGLSFSSPRYLSIRIDESVNLGGAHPSDTSHAHVFDLDTGREVDVAQIFSSTAATDKAIRTALVTANTEVELSAADVAPLTIVKDRNGSTAPLNCYPTEPGLHCIVDQGAVLAHAVGALEATVPWTSLAVR